MNNATHTPGPWATDGREAAWDILGGDNNRIASVWRNVGKPQDARLIAAAPDLLAALEAVSGIISDAMNDDDCNAVSPLGGYIFGDVMQDAMSNARNAIAKAKGE